MTDWTAGYVTDIGYTFGYYPELNPLRMRLAFLNSNVVCPEVVTACELGFGQGLSINIHAAASGAQWFGTDFNPEQAGFARELEAVSAADVQLFDASFAEFSDRRDLPDFDYIGLHGVWSWISDEHRSVIINLIRNKLKVGGVLYISYNTQPGWATMVPMRDLLAEHSDVMGSSGQGIISRLNASLAFAERLLATNPAYARANSQIPDRIKKLKEQNRNYLAHEYFNRNWLPMSFSRMAEWLAPTKLSYACSAHYLDQIDAINLSAEQQAFLKEIPDAMFRETVRDFCVNQSFRRDYWVKGSRRVSPLAQGESFRAQRVVLVQPRTNVSLKVTGSLGEAQMQEAVYDPILDTLANHQPKTLGQIEQAVKEKGISFAQLRQAAMILTGNGALLAVQDETTAQKAKKHTDKLNAFIVNNALNSSDISYLASPVTGGGITVGRIQQLFLLAKIKGKKQPAEWAEFVWQVLTLEGQRIIKAGKTLETTEDNLAELTAQATTFADKQLPILKALGIV